MVERKNENQDEELPRRHLLIGSTALGLALVGMYRVAEPGSSVVVSKEGEILAEASSQFVSNKEKRELPTIAWSPDTVAYWRELFRRESAKYQIDPRFVEIITTLESGGYPLAVSGVGAIGLMQIMPRTATEIAQKLEVENYDLKDPATNVQFGTFYLAERLAKHKRPGRSRQVQVENIRRAAIGYNGGDGRVNMYRSGLEIPEETRKYSNRAVNMWQQRNRKACPTYDRWKRKYGGEIGKARAYFQKRGIEV